MAGEARSGESGGRWIVISDRGDLLKSWQFVNPMAVLQNNMSKFPRFSDIIKVRDAHARTITVFVTNHIPWQFSELGLCVSPVYRLHSASLNSPCRCPWSILTALIKSTLTKNWVSNCFFFHVVHWDQGWNIWLWRERDQNVRDKCTVSLSLPQNNTTKESLWVSHLNHSTDLLTSTDSFINEKQ